MAIIVEEERKPTNWIGIASAAVVVIVLFVGSYYLFFKRPEFIEVVLPGSLQNLTQLSQLSFDPRSIVDPSTGEKSAKIFRALRQYGADIEAPTPGRSNPFRPF